MRHYMPNIILPLLLLSLTETGYAKKPDYEVVIDMEKVVVMRPALPDDTSNFPRARTIIRLLGESGSSSRYVTEDIESIKRLLPTAAKVSPPDAK